MGHQITWEEIKRSYPDEWVAITNLEGDVESPFGNISGNVLAHNKDEAAFTTQLKQTSPHQSIDIRFTGELLPDNPVGPVLWQFSDTSF